MRTKRSHHRITLGLAVLIAVTAGCGGRGQQAEPDAADADPAHMSGRSYYRFTCSPCHGREGRGMGELYPPLRGGSWVNADPAVAIRIVLHGLEGEITVDGVRCRARACGNGAAQEALDRGRDHRFDRGGSSASALSSLVVIEDIG